MKSFTVINLEELLDSQDYPNFLEAINYCREALKAGENCQFWETQLGYLCFLDFKSDYYYKYSSSIFQTLVAKDPQDINARFWSGYISVILYDNVEFCRDELQEVLRISPKHPYANLVMSDYVEPDQQIRLLQTVLNVQEINRRAYVQLVKALITHRRFDEARSLLEKAFTHSQYNEQKYGIMNGYINDVFVGKYSEQEWNAEVNNLRDQLDEIENGQYKSS